ncbi:MAG: glycosyltransferase [Flavobacteriales bacterium]|nr:glycosyltransferase [Flavobacteriales bacterium]MBL6872678.1 glycosyltransferase [Flavobacteriales bacterium]
MIVLYSILLLLYLFQIKSYSKGWSSLPTVSPVNDIELSILVAFRNEAKHLPFLLSDLENQNYSLDKVQFIFVDDSSEDNSFEIVKSSSLNITLLSSEGSGKKAAIELGVNNAKHDVILTTDADCRLSKDWISLMVSPFSEKDVQLVSGPVAYHGLDNAFKKFQALEFMSLIGSGAGAIGVQKAIMCNGANMGFRTSAFSNTEKDIASGDDVFLLHHVKKNNGKISFVKDSKAIVSTEPKPTLSEFLNQRKRWASKTSSYKDVSAQWVSLLVFLANLSFVALFIKEQILALIIFYLFKAVVDFLFLRKLCRFFEYDIPFYVFFILELVYPFYIVWVAISSQFGQYKWKGRKYKK